MCRCLSIGVLAMLGMPLLTEVATAKNVVLPIPMQGVDTRSDERGEYYIVKFDLPDDLAGKRLDSVFLDFVVDATPVSEAEADAAPLVAAFPLTVESDGASLEYESDVPSVRPVSMGVGQEVRLDITDIARGWLANPTSNHGLIIGTMTGQAVGTISLKDAVLGPGEAFRVTFFYQNRSGERRSTK